VGANRQGHKDSRMFQCLLDSSATCLSYSALGNRGCTLFQCLLDSSPQHCYLVHRDGERCVECFSVFWILRSTLAWTTCMDWLLR